MEGAIVGVLGLNFNRRAEEKDTGDQQLLKEIDQVKRSLEMVTARFDYQSDPDLVEACIYEMQALSARFRYLTREAKNQGLTGDFLQNLQRLE